MKRITFLFLLLATSLFAQQNADQEEWMPLFNGKDLTGWQPKIRGHELGENPGNTFRVVDGKMTVSYDQYEAFDNKFGHIFYEAPFSYYRIRVEYRFLGEQVSEGPGWAFRNSGIMVHCQAPESMGKEQDFPICIEVQLLGGRGSGERSTANLCTPGTHVVMNNQLLTQHCLNSSSKTYHGDQWVTAEVVVLGDSHIEHFVNGEPVLHYTMPQVGGANVDALKNKWIMKEGELLDNGYISLQSESHPVEFRKVELLDLEGCMDPEASNYKSYFVKADNSTCEYE